MFDVTLPDAKTDQEIILTFRDDYHFLSNFWPCDIILPAEGHLPALSYGSVENAYQAWKSVDLKVRQAMQDMTASETKKYPLSDQFTVREDATPGSKLKLMEGLLRQKFSDKNPDLKQKLLNTGDALLVEGNDWHDTFWGFSLIDGYGQNHLGRTLMTIRTELS